MQLNYIVYKIIGQNNNRLTHNTKYMYNTCGDIFGPIRRATHTGQICCQQYIIKILHTRSWFQNNNLEDKKMPSSCHSNPILHLLTKLHHEQITTRQSATLHVPLITKPLRLVGRLDPVNRSTNTSWVGVITPTDLPKSVRNRCVIDVFGGVFCVATLLFSAPEPKAQVHYCDHALSVVRLSVCPSVVNFPHFLLLLWKLLNRIQRNLTWINISTSSTKFVFFGPIGKTRWPPWPLIGWDIFDFFSETTERNSTKLNRNQHLNILYQVCVFRADRKNKMAALASDWLRHFRLLLWNRCMEFNET